MNILIMSPQLSQGGENIMCMIHAFLQHRQPGTIFLFHRNFSQVTEVLTSPLPRSLCGQMKFSLFALLGWTEGLQSSTTSSKALQRNSFITEIIASPSLKTEKFLWNFQRTLAIFSRKVLWIFQITFTISCNSPYVWDSLHSFTTGIKMTA